MPRLQRLTDFIARLLGKEWDVRALDQQRSSRPDNQRSSLTSDRPGSLQSCQDEPPAVPPDSTGAVDAVDAAGSAGPPYSGGSTGSADSADSAESAGPSGRSGLAEATVSAQTPDASRTWSSGSGRPDSPSPETRDTPDETTEALTLARVESMLTGPMEYKVQLAGDREHPCLLGTWDSFPFVIEIPEGHEGWLLVSGDWEEAAPASQRDEIAASVNDWNRDKFFPTVGVVDTPIGPLVRATYLTDLSAGATDAQLRLHLDTALSACTQALSLAGPLLPEI